MNLIKQNAPGGWMISKIADICDVKGGKRIPKGYSLQDEDNGIPYITVSDMYNGGVNTRNIRYVPNVIAQKIVNYKITTKDLFISVAGTLGIVGQIPIELNNANLTENADKFTNIKINQKLLLNILLSERFQNK